MGVNFHMRLDMGSPGRGVLLSSFNPHTVFVEPGGAAPEFIHTPDGPYWIIDHHTGVKRDVTLSAGQQALRGAMAGDLDEFVREEGELYADIVFKQCDQDDAAAYYVFEHEQEVRTNPDPDYQRNLRAFYDMAGTLDATAGIYPYPPNDETMEHIAWAFTPFTALRKSGELDRRDPTTYLAALAEMSGRIALVLAGKGERRQLDTRYEVLGGGPLREQSASKWLMIEEVGEHGRIAAAHDYKEERVHAFVIVRHRQDGRLQVTLCRSSEAVDFDIPSHYNYFNQLEDCAPNDQWGGGTTVGGSPQRTGTSLTIEDLNRHIPLAQQFSDYSSKESIDQTIPG